MIFLVLMIFSVNGVQVTSGLMVVPYVDQIALDGKLVTGWEAMNAIYDNNYVSKSTTKTIMNNDNERKSRNHKNKGTKNKLNSEQFEYVKYYKPLGVICTTDSSIKNNVIFSLTKVHQYTPRHRIYPVGRLDKETSGLIILTSDGRVVNSALRGENKQSKVYHVTVNDNLQESHLQRLRDGVVIKTVAQRKGRTEGENTLIAKTRPCKVSRISSSYNGEKNYKKNECQITLVEGRNRQIRKMMEVLGFQVIKLRRVEFLGIQLTGGSNGLRKPGDWAILDDDELRMLQKAMDSNTDS